jgi:hypothetical protein
MTLRVPLAVLLALAVLLPMCLVPTVEGAEHPQAMGVEARLHQEILISEASGMPVTDRYLPDVAWNFVREQYLVVWQNTWPGSYDIYARRMTRDGTLLAWFDIACPGSCLQPAVAFGASNAEYLVVYMVDVHGDGSQYEIWGTITAWDGTYRVGPFPIIGWPGRTFWAPRVVWNNNRNEWFVAWNAFDTSTGLPNDIAGKRVFADYSVEANAVILTTSTYPHQVDLAYNWSTDEWFIAFVRSYLPSATGNDIYGQRVSYDSGGNLVPGSIVEIYSGSKHQDAPVAVVDGQGSYMVAWQHQYEPPPTPDHDVYAQKLGPTGSKLGGVYPLATSSYDETSPDLTATYDSSPEYVATWAKAWGTNQAIMAHRWGAGLPPRNFTISDVNFWDNDNPAIAPGRPGYWIVYEGDDLAVTSQIYGLRLVPNAVFLPIAVRN